LVVASGAQEHVEGMATGLSEILDNLKARGIDNKGDGSLVNKCKIFRKNENLRN
jgi:hypothetical protein